MMSASWSPTVSSIKNISYNNGDGEFGTNQNKKNKDFRVFYILLHYPAVYIFSHLLE